MDIKRLIEEEVNRKFKEFNELIRSEIEELKEKNRLGWEERVRELFKEEEEEDILENLIETLAIYRDMEGEEKHIRDEIEEAIKDLVNISRVMEEDKNILEGDGILYIYNKIPLPNGEDDESVDIYITPNSIEYKVDNI